MKNTTVNTNPYAHSTKPRHRYIKSLSLGINDILFRSNKIYWALLDFMAVFLLFQYGLASSPWGQKYLWSKESVVSALVFSTTYVLSGIGIDYYNRNLRVRITKLIITSVFLGSIGLVTSLATLYFLYYGLFGRLTLLSGAFFATVPLVFIKILIAFILRRNPYRFSVIGQSQLFEELLNKLNKNKLLNKDYVYVPWPAPDSKSDDDIVNELLISRVGDIIITAKALDDSRTIDLSIKAIQAKMQIVSETDFYEQIFERVSIETASKDTILLKGIASRKVFVTLAKRIFDIVSASAALVVLSPLFLIIIAAVKFTSKGPVFFVQERQGRYFRPFKMFKFRTMKIEDCDVQGKSNFTEKNDPRVTSIGRILRPLHFDELPQLLNIIIGDMSVVGPRPEALDFAQKMKVAIPVYEMRYLMRPGLTGHAQINQGYAMNTVEDVKMKLSYDLFYLCNYGLLFDLQLIMKTVFFLAKGAR